MADEPNRAEGALVITNGFQSSASLTIDASGMQENCVTFDTMTNELNVKLKQPIEISEVVVTTVRGKHSKSRDSNLNSRFSRKSLSKPVAVVVFSLLFLMTDWHCLLSCP